MTAKIKLHFWNQHKKLRWLRKKNYTRNYQNNTLTTKKSHKSAKIDTFEQKRCMCHNPSNNPFTSIEIIFVAGYL